MSLLNAIVTVVVGGEQKEKFIVNMPNIRNLKGFLKGAWDLSVYDGCFPKRNRLGDVDGSVEIHGQTLHIEFKESRYSMNQGQVLKAIRQAKYAGITTFFVFGKQDIPTAYLKFTPADLQPDYIECDTETLKEAFKLWSAFAEENNLVDDRTSEWDLVGKYFRKQA